MRECRICHKKIHLFDKYDARVKGYCPSCYAKKSSKEEEQNNKAKSENQSPKGKIPGWLLWLIIIIIGLYLLTYQEDYKEDYKYCIEDCVSENYDCLSSEIRDVGTTEFILWDDAENCQTDLEICTETCKI
jgi:hypothetical protein